MREIELGKHTVWVMDSISYINAKHRDCIVVSASHGGLSSARYALEHPPLLTVFNDAGVGKDKAGIAALDRLEQNQLAALAISANSARIGDGEDTWENALITHANPSALELGFEIGKKLKNAIVEIYS